ncbi:MAG: hypothetical protein AVDCRST_MAG06-1261, partial [uncultured Nocardioides sp.]
AARDLRPAGRRQDDRRPCRRGRQRLPAVPQPPDDRAAAGGLRPRHAGVQPAQRRVPRPRARGGRGVRHPPGLHLPLAARRRRGPGHGGALPRAVRRGGQAGGLRRAGRAAGGPARAQRHRAPAGGQGLQAGPRVVRGQRPRVRAARDEHRSRPPHARRGPPRPAPPPAPRQQRPGSRGRGCRDPHLAPRLL